MIRVSRRGALVLGLTAMAIGTAKAEKKYAPGVTDTEILIGSTQPFSGPASSYATIGRCSAAYVRMLNEQGGIGGRKINLLQLDDSFSPPKTVEQTRRLVEQDRVAFIFAQLGTAPATAARKYLNEKKIPDIFVSSGATQFFNEQEKYPWTIGWQPSYQIEARIYAKYIMQTKPDAKIAILHQNDDSGRDILKGIRDGLGPAADKTLVSVTSFEITDPTPDSQVVSSQGSGANVFFFAGIPKMSAATIRKVYDMGWKPLFIISNPAASVATALRPAGLEKCVGLITTAYMKDPTDPQWNNDEGYKVWRAFMAKYYPEGDVTDTSNVYGYSQAQCLEQVLRQCGDDLSRENVMAQALNLDIQLPMFQPGVRFTSKGMEYSAVRKLRLVRFDGSTWVPFGEPVGA